MNICTNIKQKFNELKIKGQNYIELKKEETTKAQLIELEECGYIVKEINNKIIISE